MRECRDAIAAGKPLPQQPAHPGESPRSCAQEFFFRGLPEAMWSPELNAKLLQLVRTKVAIYDSYISEMEQMPADETYLAQHSRSLASRPIRVLSTGNHGVHSLDPSRPPDPEQQKYEEEVAREQARGVHPEQVRRAAAGRALTEPRYRPRLLLGRSLGRLGIRFGRVVIRIRLLLAHFLRIAALRIALSKGDVVIAVRLGHRNVIRVLSGRVIQIGHLVRHLVGVLGDVLLRGILALHDFSRSLLLSLCNVIGNSVRRLRIVAAGGT
jgi:hypothetical protein